MMDFQTRPDVCQYMVSLLPDRVKTVLEPTPGIGNLVLELCKKYEVTAPEDFWLIRGKWDAVVMNPPFSPMRVGYEILYACLIIAPVIIALMPWLTIINSQSRLTFIRDYGLVSVTHMPRSIFPGARVQTCVLNMQLGYKGKTELLWWGGS